ncbi:hypothetical protein D5086_033964 [Populus alba]|uniref:Uncharacterized protein n=1 Tax=Populus alba TaxID=43335 RepID=A0ACC4AI82_POPAL
MYASATCPISDVFHKRPNALTRLLPQTAKGFDYVSFVLFRLRWPGCRNSVAFEFLVIPLEHVCLRYFFYIRQLPQTVKRFDSHVCFRYLFYIRLLPQTAKRFDSHVCFRYLVYIILLPQIVKRFDSVSFAAFRLRCHGCRNSVGFEFWVIPFEHVCFRYLFYIRLIPQTAKRFDSVSFAAFRN